MFLVSLACLVGISVSFEYQGSHSPSPEHPYLSAGRLIFGSVVAYAVLYANGLRALVARWLGDDGVLWGLALLAIVMLGVDLAHTWPLFAHPFNDFGLP